MERSTTDVSVPALRKRAIELRRDDMWPQLLRLSTSDSKADRMLAGYALPWFLGRVPAGTAVAGALCADDEWQVREAATFGVREASIKDFEAVRGLLSRWSESSDANLHRAVLVIARQPRTQQAAVVLRVLDLVDVVIRDTHPYVRRNVAFALRYLSRAHPRPLIAFLEHWASSGPHLAWCACQALTQQLAAVYPAETGAIIARLAQYEDRVVARALARALSEARWWEGEARA